MVSSFRIILIVGLLLLSSCSKKAPSLFERIPSNTSGVSFVNHITSSPQLNILNYIYFYNGAGVATADFNNDGFIDLYFTGNQSKDALYLNKGEFHFEEVTEIAGIQNGDGWTNGVTVVDINGDHYLDIYLSKVGNYHSLKGKNKLYINRGPDDKGIPFFEEQASAYNLDFSGFSTQASFFDYDLDGDLDLFLLNHSTNPNQNYGKGSNRTIPNKESGDKLFENIDGLYVDVTESAQIFQSKFGYGLGVSVGDLNQDGYPDIYVSNDFFENDYLYLNNGDKTFTEVIHSSDSIIGHTTHYSMGNDIQDINNDGYPDIVSLDMLPEDLTTYKTSGSEFNYQIYQNYIRNGYAHQFMQNALQLNNGNGTFSEIGYISGISATEWSWSPLIADFDNDGLNDLFISNGILGATNDMDFINFIANEEIQKTLGQDMTEKEMAFIDKIPVKKTPNYFFKNIGGNQFRDVTNQWFQALPSFSNGSAYADLDNDGDLDLVVNNVNEEAFLLQNRSELFAPNRHHLKIKLEGPDENTFGIGARVALYAHGKKWTKENFPTRGYLSSVPPELLFGLGEYTEMDSLQVIWPDGFEQTLFKTKVDTTLLLKYTDAKQRFPGITPNRKELWALIDVPLDFDHQENVNLEFNRDALLPFALGNEGPAAAVADVNNDGLEDLFLGGGKGQGSQLFMQKIDGTFTSQQPELFQINKLAEDVDAIFADLNNDGFKDLLVVSGGNELSAGENSSPRLYWNKKGSFEKDKEAFQRISINASKVCAADWNGDGFKDIAIFSNTIPQKFGMSPQHYFFLNKGQGNFEEVTRDIFKETALLAQVNDVEWKDFNGDGLLDFITVGDWAPLQLYLQEEGHFILATDTGLEDSNGWWNTIKVIDLDNDGDLDLLAGNWGLNTRLKASRKEPVRLYKTDFDNNGSDETLITYYYMGVETTLASKEELSKQMPFINKKYLSFEAFAKASMPEVFSAEKLEGAMKKEVYELGSCYFENTGNLRFTKHLLPFETQISTVNDMFFIGDGREGVREAVVIGNNYELSTQLGRLDAQHGTLLRFPKGVPTVVRGSLPPLSGAGRKIVPFIYKGEPILIILRNNDKPLFIKNRYYAND